MAKKKDKPSLAMKIGVWSYVAGIIIALLVSLVSAGGPLDSWSLGFLVVFGLIVGLLNINEQEVVLYLVAAISFIIAADKMSDIFSALGVAFAPLQTFMHAIIVFTAPGALVVSFLALYRVAKDE